MKRAHKHEVNATALKESPIFSSMAGAGDIRPGAYGETIESPREFNAEGSVEHADTDILDRKTERWEFGLLEDKGAVPTLKCDKGPVEKVRRTPRASNTETNAAALAGSTAFSGLAKSGRVSAASIHNKKLVKQLNDALAVESNPVAREFLKAVLSEVRKR